MFADSNSDKFDKDNLNLLLKIHTDIDMKVEINDFKDLCVGFVLKDKGKDD